MNLLPVIRWTLACAALLTVRPDPAQGDPASTPTTNVAATPLRPSLREIWVPTEDLAPVLGRYPRAVSLDHDQLFNLLRDAHAGDATNPDFDNPPPIRAAIRQANFEGWLAVGPDGKTQVQVEGQLALESLSDAWAELPLGLPGIALGSVEINDPQASETAGLRRVSGKNDGSVSVEIQGRGVHQLRLGFVLPVKADAEGNSIALPTLTGTGQFILHLPAGARADSLGGCAVQADGAGIIARVALRHAAREPVVSSTAIRDFAKPERASSRKPPNIEPDRLSWRTPPPASTEPGALLQTGRTEATVNESGLKIRQEIRLRPAFGRLPEEVRFRLPAMMSAVRVEGPSVGQWGVGADGLHVPLVRSGEGDGTAVFTVDYFLALTFDGKGRVPLDLLVLVLEATDAHRVSGEIVVKRDRGITVQRVEPASAAVSSAVGIFSRAEETAPDFVAGFSVVDLPVANNGSPLAALTVDARRNATRFSVDADVRADFQLDGAHIARTLAFRVEEGEVFAARVKLPAGEAVSALHAANGGKEPDWRQEGNELILSWTAGLPESSVTLLTIESRAELSAPKPGAPAEFHLGAALVPGAERLTGYIALASTPAFRLVTTGGEERLERRDGRSTPVRGDVAWFYRDDFRLTLRVERRTVETEARFTGYALPLAGAVEIHAQIDYRFLYSGVETVKVRVPREWAEAFFFTGDRIAERRRDDDVWTIRFQGEQSGDYVLGVQATIPAPADKENAQRFHFRLPVIVPLESTHWSGAWAVEANTDTEIGFAVVGATEVDTLHAPPLAGYQPKRRIIGVFEFLGGTANTAIDLDGVRHPAAGGAAAVVDRLDLQTDASTSGVMRHRATVRARMVGDGFFNLHLPRNAALWSLTLDGEPVKPIRGADAADEVRVELPGGRPPSNASTIVVVYETSGQPWNGMGWRSAVAPKFDADVPVLHSHWTVSVPDGFEYRFANVPSEKISPNPASGDLLVPRMATALGHAAQWVYYYPWFGKEFNTQAAPRWMATEVRKRAERRAAGETSVEMLDMAEPQAADEQAAQSSPADTAQELAASSSQVTRRGYAKINDSSGTNAVTHKLRSIIIPNIEFRQTTLNDAVEFLRQEARRLDTASPDDERGVNIFLKLGSGNAPARNNANIAGLPPGAETSAPAAMPTGNTRITLTLSRIPLLNALDYTAKAANLKIKIEPYAVSIVPLTEETGDMVTMEIPVSSELLKVLSNSSTSEPSSQTNVGGTVDTTGTGTVNVSRADARTFLESSGVTFPPGASAVYLRGSNKLVVRNTQSNIDLVTTLTSPAGNSSPLPPLPTLNGRESPKGVPGLLPLRLDLPENGMSYEFDGGGLAALDFHYADLAVAARWRWVWLTFGAFAFLFGAAAWANPWQRTLYVVLALTFFPLIVAPSSTVTCNALLAGWLWAVAGWCVTRFLLRRRRIITATALVVGATLLSFSPANAAPARSPSPSPAPELVIVPYDATKPIAGQTPTAYYLPYERFLLLWDAAKRHRRPPAPEPPPGGERYLLGTARYDARLDGDTLEVAATLDVQTFGEDWVGVPLRFELNRIRTVMLDGAPAALGGDGILWIGKPGGHRVNVSLRLPAANVTAGTHLSWSVPPTVATLVTLLLPRADVRAEIRGSTPDAGVIEETIPEGRRQTASLGGTSTVEVTFRDAPAPVPVAGQPSLASVEARLTASARQESLSAEVRFAFPNNTQDHFTLLLDRGLTLTSLDTPDVRQWHLTAGGDRQSLEIILNAPVRDAYRLAFTADRLMGPLPSVRRVFPLVSAQAIRVERIATLLTEGAVELSLPDGTPAGMRRVNVAAPERDHAFAAFAGDGTAALTYSVRNAMAKRSAHINYLYQVGRGKIELAASVRLQPAAGEPLVTTDFRLPAGFTVQAVIGESVQQWWRDGDMLSLRFRPGIEQGEVRLLVYLVRQFERAPERFALRPMVASGFTATDGETVVATDGSFKVGLTLPAGVRAEELSEINAATAAREFEVKAPLERQRAFRYRGAEFDVAATLENQPPRWQAQWVTQATIRDGAVTLETHVHATMLLGSVDALEFSLPTGSNEARVNGSELRETIIAGNNDGRRTYRVLFQNALYAGVGRDFTISLELPLDAGNRATLPDLAFSGEGGRAATGFILAENASSGEMTLDAHGLEPAIEKDVPFLPPWIVAGTRFYRVAPGVPWSLGVQVTNLEKTAGRAALVAYAELTTTLRTNGEEWHRATYRLQNRRLQFLPVELPPGMELIGARVAGESVRVDAGQSENGASSLLLVPLVKTRPGETSYDVEVIYRRTVPDRANTPSRSAFGHWEMQDPRLPGIPVEKTLWDVYLPTDARLLNTGGNLESVVAAVSTTEKLESALSDLRELSATYQSNTASEEVRQRALTNYHSLAAQVTQQAKAKTTDRWVQDKDSQSALFKKPDVASQNAAAHQQQQVILEKVDSLNASNEIMDQRMSGVSRGSMTTNANPQFDGFINYGSPIQSVTRNAASLGWRDNRAGDTHISAGNTTVTLGPERGDTNLGRDFFALNDSVTVNLPAKDAELAGNLKRIEPPKTESAKPTDDAPQSENRLSTARAGSGNKAPARPNLAPPAQSAPITTSAPSGAATPAAPPMVDGLTANKEVRRETLRSEGHISLAVDFPVEGQVYHFKKIKGDARLTLWSAQPTHFARLGWLGLLLAGLALLWAVRRTVRRFRPIPDRTQDQQPALGASIG